MFRSRLVGLSEDKDVRLLQEISTKVERHKRCSEWRCRHFNLDIEGEKLRGGFLSAGPDSARSCLEFLSSQNSTFSSQQHNANVFAEVKRWPSVRREMKRLLSNSCATSRIKSSISDCRGVSWCAPFEKGATSINNGRTVCALVLKFGKENCEPGVAQKENYLSFAFEFEMTAAFGAEGRTVQGWVFDFSGDFFFFFFFFLDSTFLQSIVTSRLPRVHSLASKSVCPFRFFIFFLCQKNAARSCSSVPPRGRTLGPIFRRSLALKLNSCQLLGGSDFSGDLFWSLSTEGSAKQDRCILQRFSRATDKVVCSAGYFGPVWAVEYYWNIASYHQGSVRHKY